MELEVSLNNFTDLELKGLQNKENAKKCLFTFNHAYPNTINFHFLYFHIFHFVKFIYCRKMKNNSTSSQQTKCSYAQRYVMTFSFAYKVIILFKLFMILQCVLLYGIVFNSRAQYLWSCPSTVNCCFYRHSERATPKNLPKRLSVKHCFVKFRARLQNSLQTGSTKLKNMHAQLIKPSIHIKENNMLGQSLST